MTGFDTSPEDVYETLHSCGFETDRIVDLSENRYVLRVTKE